MRTPLVSALLVLASMANAAPDPGAVAAAAPTDRHAVEVRAGALVPAQVLDGPNLRLRAGWRYRLADAWWLHVELGTDRVTVQGLDAQVDVPGGAARLSVDHAVWSVPGLLGFGWQTEAESGAGVGLMVAGGVAWWHASQSSRVVEGPTLGEESETGWDALIQGRLDQTWRLPSGRLVVGAGWQEVFRLGGAPALGDVRTSGLFVEGGWRGRF